MKFFPKALVLAATVGAVSFAQAGAIDVSGVVTEVAAQGVPIGLVGTAVMLIVVAVKAFHWVRRALS